MFQLLSSKPDPDAKALTVLLSGTELVWRYQGKSREVMARLADIFKREIRLPVTTKVIGADLHECRIALSSATDAQIGYLPFFLLSFLGPAVFV